MKLVSVEVLKLVKARFFWVLVVLTLAILGLYAYQYTVNQESGVYLDDFRNPWTLSAGLLLAYVTLYHVPIAVAMGGFSVGQEYSNGTSGLLVVQAGRYRPICAKIGALAILCVGVSLLVAGEGIVWGVIVGRGLHGFAWLELMRQVLAGAVIPWTASLLAMVVASLTQSVAVADIFTMLLFVVITMMFITTSRWLSMLMPAYWWMPAISHWFSSLDAIHVKLGVTPSLGASTWRGPVLGGLSYAAMCVGLQVVLSWRREYAA